MRQPAPRGRLSEAVAELLRRPPQDDPSLVALAARTAASSADVLRDDDVQVALLTLYELHYQGIDGSDPAWEWSPTLIAARTTLEEAVEARLRELTADTVVAAVDALGARPAADDVAKMLFTLADEDEGPSVSRYMASRATVEEYREFVIHRSVYHLKEADPHTWAIPRLTGRAKAGLVEVQVDEYGGGRPERMHSTLFARLMRALGLDDRYGAYVDAVPATTLATVTGMSLFGLHRRLRGAVAGHLAILEMTSSLPNRLYGNGLRRLGYDGDATLFYDEHVEADAVHEQVAGRDVAGGLVEDHPALLPDVILGAATCLLLEGLAGHYLMDAWRDGRSSLRDGVTHSPRS